VQEQMRVETRALNERATRLATARATADGLQAAEQARDTAKAQLAALGEWNYTISPRDYPPNRALIL